jgi:hypothetical protein
MESPHLPQYLLELLARHPPFVDRARGAKLVTENFFPTNPRALVHWDLPVKFINRRAFHPTRELLAAALERLHAAPLTRPTTPTDQQEPT